MIKKYNLKNFINYKFIKNLFREHIQTIFVESIILSPFLRKLYILRSLSNFNKDKFKSHCKSPKLTIAILWDADRRFKWLHDEAYSRNINIFYFQRAIFRPVWNYLLIKNGYSINNELGEVPFEQIYDSKYLKKRERYLQFCRDASIEIKNYCKADIFLLPKLNDDWIIDLIKALRKENINTTVHDREHGISNQRMKIYPKMLSRHISDLKVDQLLVSNKLHKEFFIKCGYEQSDIIITGKPDTDYWFSKELKPNKSEISSLIDPKKKLILFFAFGRRNYLNFYYKGEKRNWLPLADDYHNTLENILNLHKDNVQVLYKIGGKPARDNYPNFNKFIKNIEKMKARDSLLILDGNNSTLDLINISDIIIGFHTLGIVEAMFTKKPIIYGAWGDLFSDIKDTLIPFHKWKGLTFCDSNESFKDEIEKLIINNKLRNISNEENKYRKLNREKIFYKPDGNTSKRILNAIEKLVYNKSTLKN